MPGFVPQRGLFVGGGKVKLGTKQQLMATLQKIYAAEVKSLGGSSGSTAASVAPTAAAAVIVADLPFQQQPGAAQASTSSSSGILNVSAASGPSSSSRVVPLRVQEDSATPAKLSSSNAEMQQIADPSVGARAAATPTAGSFKVHQQNGDFMHEMSSLLGEAEDYANAVLDQTQEQLNQARAQLKAYFAQHRLRI